MGNKKELSEKELEAKALEDAMDNFYAKKEKNKSQEMEISSKSVEEQNFATPTNIPPKMEFNPSDFQSNMQQETDPDLLLGYDIVELPSKGLFYNNGIKEITVEYLTAKDEDLLTTPALLENGTVLDTLLRKKIKTKNIDIDKMLTGDKNAVLLFLRASSYGHNYEVSVKNPYTGTAFKTNIDLRKLKYKEIEERPDSSGEFTVDLPMRKKKAKFKLLTHKENKMITKNAESMQEAYNSPFAETGTLRIKAALTQIGDMRDKDYINKFVDAMPAGDALAIRKKMKGVEPDIDMNYEFTTPDGKLFTAPIIMGIDFFFPSL